jgi:hypothetical protein
MDKNDKDWTSSEDNKEQLNAQDAVLETVVEQLELINIQSTVLNERVYTKNYLDRIRNFLIGLAIVFFVGSTIVLALVLIQIKQNDEREAKRAEDRAFEAVLQRRQFADCQVSPGTPLFEGAKPGGKPYINPGICFSKTQDRMDTYLSYAVSIIFDGIRFSNNCIYLRSQNERPEICDEVNARVDALRKNENPFSTVIPT